nr:tetratricopeptide repeat domain protein [uncultured Gammaproteobacteria bacterium]
MRAQAVFGLVLLAAVLGVGAKSLDLSAQLDLAAQMIQSGQATQALGVLLAHAPPKGDKEQAIQLRRRYHTLVGLAYLKLSQYPQAVEHLEQAARSGAPEPLIYVYLAQGYFRLGRYDRTLAAIEHAGEILDRYPALYEIKAQCLWHLQQEEAAFATLAKARQKFPTEPSFLRRQVFYLLEKQLYYPAAQLGLRYLQDHEGSVQDYAALGNALRLGGALELAAHVLEQGRLRYRRDTTLAKLLAHTYLAQGKPLAAAWILEQAAQFDPSLYADAAELYRRAGDFYRALYLNAQVPDVKAQRRQRVALLLALKRYDEALAMQRALARAGLLQEDAVRYALAYAAYRTGKLEQVETYLQAISDPQIFRQAAELRRLLQECEDQPWRCA